MYIHMYSSRPFPSFPLNKGIISKYSTKNIFFHIYRRNQRFYASVCNLVNQSEVILINNLLEYSFAPILC